MDESPLHMSAQSQSWPCTIGGWVWYCDVHDAHGNADLHEEAQATARGHQHWWQRNGDDEGCDIVITAIEPASPVDVATDEAD